MLIWIKTILIAGRQGPWILLGLLLLWQPVRVVLAEGEVYTWKDAAGRGHDGNHPPEGQAAQPVLLNADPVLTVEQAATYLNVRDSFIRDLNKQRRIETVKVVLSDNLADHVGVCGRHWG